MVELNRSLSEFVFDLLKGLLSLSIPLE